MASEFPESSAHGEPDQDIAYQIDALRVAGLTDADIAERLGVSMTTVQTGSDPVMDKFQSLSHRAARSEAGWPGGSSAAPDAEVTTQVQVPPQPVGSVDVGAALQLRARWTGHHVGARWGTWSRMGPDPVLATGGDDSMARLWTPKGSGSFPTEYPHSRPLMWGCWSPAGADQMLATGTADGEVTLWIPGPNGPQTVPVDGGAQSAAWGTWVRTGSLLVLATSDRIWSAERWRNAETTRETSMSITRTNDVQARWGALCVIDETPTLATGGADGVVRTWNARSNALLHEIGVGDATTWGRWHRRADAVPVLAIGTMSGDVWIYGHDGSIYKGALSTHDGPVLWGAWSTSGDGSVLATGGQDGTVRFNRLPTSRSVEPRVDITVHQAPALWGAWARVGPTPVLATGGDDGSVRLWTGSAQVTVVAAHTSPVRWGAWSQSTQGPILATGGDDGTVRAWELFVERSVRKRPRYRSDDGEGADRLSRLGEATALADLVLSTSARPPMAVGLFGEWGEGKSYFLRMVKQQVTAIADANPVYAYRNVRQIDFNAWHYAETDLWASLVSEIFTQLAAPRDAGVDRDIGAEQRTQSRLASEIVAKRRLPERIAAERARAEQLRASLKPPRWQSLSPDQQSELETAVGGLDPTLVEQAYSAARVPSAWLTLTRQRVSRIWRALPAKAKWALPVAAAAVVAGAVILLAVPALSARIGGILAGLGGLAGITAIWRTVNDQAREAHKRFTDIKATIGDTVERWQAPVQIALDVSEKNVATLERELQELTAAGQLAGFVADRSAAGSYRASLGLMTQVRQDFQAMSQLLTKDSAERASGQLEGLDDVDAGGDTVPRIDRIVLYIDDLDRCPPQRVVEMLEAVHLLLAVPLFVVIVAVDPRWLLRAIGLHYREILTSPSTADPNETPTPADPADDDYWASTPAQYLEKIFQLVFTLPPMSPSGYTALLDDLIGPRADLDVAEVASTLFDHRPATDSNDAAAPSLAQPDVSPAVDEDEDVHDDVDAPVTLSPAPIEDRVDPLALNSAELTLIRFLGPPLITTPRAVKRLANSYGLLAAIRRLTHPDDETDDTLPAMVLLAALTGFPSLGPQLLTHLHRRSTAAPDLAWTTFIGELLPDGAQGRSNALDPRLTAAEAEAWRTLAHALQNINQLAGAEEIDLPAAIRHWEKWIVPVGRLSFPAGSVVARLDRTAQSTLIPADRHSTAPR